MEKPLNFRGLGLPWQLEDLLMKVIDNNTALEAQVADLRAQIAAIPRPLTLQEIAQGLSSSGPSPLNLTGLPGK